MSEVPGPITESLAALYEAYASGLLAFLCGRLKDASAAEEVLHDVFLAYHRQAARTTIAAPKAYLYAAAQRMSINLLRRNALAARARDRLAAQAAFVTAPGADPFDANAAREALSRLDSDERDVLTMRIYGELSFQEIAGILETSIQTVSRRHASGIAALRRALEGAASSKDSEK